MIKSRINACSFPLSNSFIKTNPQQCVTNFTAEKMDVMDDKYIITYITKIIPKNFKTSQNATYSPKTWCDCQEWCVYQLLFVNITADSSPADARVRL